MLLTIRELQTYTVRTADDISAQLEDLYVEDQFWRIRYLVITVGSWLNKQSYLVVPEVITAVDVDSKRLELEITGDQLRDSPPIERHQPISRQYEEALAEHFGWVRYWLPANLLAQGLTPVLTPTISQQETVVEATEIEPNSLRSCQELATYKVSASQDASYALLDLALQLDTWQLRFLLLDDVGDKPQPVSCDFVSRCDWVDQKIFLSISAEQIQNLDPYLPEPIGGLESG